MARYVGIRVLMALLVLWAAYTVSFIILYMIPGDPVLAMAAGGGDPSAVDEETLATYREAYGFNDPLIVQYFNRLGAAITGDFGESMRTGQPVSTAIAEVIPSTAQLAGVALLLAVVLGAAIAMLATYTNITWLKNLLLSLPPLAISLPTFFIGLLLIQVFSFQLGWLPALGGANLAGIILPAITLSLPIGAVICQVFASSLERSSAESYVNTARAKGLNRFTVHLRHVAQTSLVPALSMVGLVAGGLLAGSVIVETVFSRPGVGQLTVQAVSTQDLPVVQGIVVLAAVVFVTVNLLVDLVLPAIDPRVRLGRRFA
ncbi:ABC transporter permease [Auritidibacter sp. NML120636]|uniref:ABC transporter permease n=1 Tax=Auritidibacter sp. NML120636 TaxID=2170743 RepID=UPI000D72BB82|nr:ABC transporter permease [Auritidibacter sp. NML120636]PXA82024.1 peptide ABC transporter permease [Auritidibacter sp. NML120636]